MSNENYIVTKGLVIDKLTNGEYKVKLDENGLEVTAHVSGKMRMHKIRILPGDKVQIEINPLDITRGIITYSFR